MRGIGRLVLLLVFICVFPVFSSAEFSDCWLNSGTSLSTCQTNEECVWRTQAQDPWCMESSGCCMDKGCWLYDSNQTVCEDEDLNGGLGCMWDSWMKKWYSNGTQSSIGGCVMDWAIENQSWGGVSTGCWNYDGAVASCAAQSSCKWIKNDQNQDPWCYVKTLSDAQNKNPSATTSDIGCCQNAGCWNYDNNETECGSALQGNCQYTNNSFGGGWCNTKSCEEIATLTNCTYTKQTLMMPCNWNNDSQICESIGGGGFGFYNNSDSCLSAGGWYNSTGGCVMPSGNFVDGSGGFMFGGEAHCWFADNKPLVCGNITGCAYCISGGGPYGISNATANICSNKQIGMCEGHNANDNGNYANANNTANLACTDIRVKSACDYGPLPNCKWTNSSVTLGTYCEVGAKTGQKSSPPAQYCEDPVAKNNYSVCIQLANDFMMPCKWQNTTYPIQNCTFNSNAVFGGSETEKDFGVINNQFACTSAGGTWNTEYYVDNENLKQDSWCEMGGFFNVDQGKGMGNKGNCDTSCWACEFQNNGTSWATVGEAESACENSVAVSGQVGGCVWKNDTGGNSFNKLGWCDYPKEMESSGAKDCNIECEGCDFAGDSKTACEGSMANEGVGCKWVNDTNNFKGGFCVDKTKKTCSSDCFSCLDVSACQNSELDCSWDSSFNLCSPDGYSGEICFDGIDNDADSLIDCSDPDCGFDNFCGGSSFGGNCFAQTTKATCNNTLAFGELNCTWINDTWNPAGWCDMPGANCWKFDNDLTACGLIPGCTNESTMMGTNTFCDINKTLMDTANCWQNNNEEDCGVSSSCAWKSDPWCSGPGAGTDWCNENPTAGWCDFKPFATCMNLNASSCGANSNCTWKQDQFSMVGGWCDVACFNQSISAEEDCSGAGYAGLCEWRDMSATCQPSTFMMMGSSMGEGGKKGCGQYDGNQTGCMANDIICSYKNESMSRNNRSIDEPSGWCMDKAEFGQSGGIGGGIIRLGEDADNVVDPEDPFDVLSEAGVDGGVDLLRFGMRITSEGFSFGTEVYDINQSIACNGFMIKGAMDETPYQGTGNATGKYYWYLDTNGDSTDGCVAVQSSGANLTGFDFMINYIVRNTTSGVVETKQLMRCSDLSWSPTNALVTTSKKMGCGEIEGVMVSVAKQDIESFAEYNKTANIRIFVSSANDSDSRVNPSDSIGPGYYTPGTLDFGFVDCSDPSNAKDTKCKNFQKFGFNVFEECKNGIDDDENGLVDCDDPFCLFIPDCAGDNAFVFSSNLNDKVAPTVVFSEVEKLSDSAFIRIDSSEPSNLSLDFYLVDGSCTSANKNITLYDTGLGFMANANFKPFHSIDLIEDTLGYSLVNDTAYYYKIKLCDPSSNCAISSCLNFTTKLSTIDKSFIFKMDLPENYTVDLPAFGKYNYNFTEVFNGVEYEIGIKTNTSLTKSMNMTLHCGNMSIGFFGINVLSPVKIDLTNAFVCDEEDLLIGMNSTLKKWNKLINDLRLGGATDYVEITLPVVYSANNVFNWTNDNGANGINVDDYVECRDGGSSNTICKIPVSMGFSAYTITEPNADVPVVANLPSGGSSSGSGGGVVSYFVNGSQLAGGYTKSLLINHQLNFTIKGVNHTLVVKTINSSGSKLVVKSTPQEKFVEVGGEWKVDIDGNGRYELYVHLDSATGSSAKITIRAIDELIPAPAVENKINENVVGKVIGTGDEEEEKVQDEGLLSKWVVSILVIILVIMVLVVLIVILRRKNEYPELRVKKR